MAKSCSGTQTLPLWTLVNPSCVYQVTLFVDSSPITNTVALNSGMTTAQIEAILNSNRTGNVTGTFTVAIVGNNLNININNIVLPDSALGEYSITASGTGFPCGNFALLPSSLACSVIPIPKKRKRLRAGIPASFCTPKNSPHPCPNHINSYGASYVKYYEDNQKCCYKQIRR